MSYFCAARQLVGNQPPTWVTTDQPPVRYTLTGSATHARRVKAALEELAAAQRLAEAVQKFSGRLDCPEYLREALADFLRINA